MQGKTLYERPALRKVSLQQAKQIMRSHVADFLELILPARRNPRIGEPAIKEKVYEKPGLRKLQPEQAKLLLLAHAGVGDRGARDLLELLFPEPGQSETEA